jgi:hypothetical protein
MQITPATVIGLALLAYALTRVPDRYKPVWTRRLGAWPTLLGLLATIAAILIVMNPEFYALGILGDSAFFELLALAIGLQLQTFGARLWRHVLAVPSMARRFIIRRFYETCLMTVLLYLAVVSPIQKLVHRIWS